MNFLKGLFNKNHQILSGRKFKDDTVYCFFADNKKYGVSILNSDGIYKEIIPPNFNSTGYEKKADVIFAVKYNADGHTLNGQHYHIFDLNGKLLAEFNEVDSISFWGEGLIIKKNKKKGVLDRNFKISIPCEYEEIIPITKDVYSAKKIEVDENFNEYNHTFNGIIDINNRVLGKFDLTSFVFHHLYENTVIVGVAKSYIGIKPKYQSYNIISRELNELPYDQVLNGHINEYHYNSQPLFTTINGVDYEKENNVTEYPSTEYHFIGKWGVVLPNGVELIPNKYDYLERLSSNLFKIAIGTPKIESDSNHHVKTFKGFKWGVIDINNNVILETEYDWIDFNEQTNTITANNGGNILWNHFDHSPEWKIEGGHYEKIDLNKTPHNNM